MGGRSGRVTRIQVDGVDITDETVGTTVTNISNESIQEFGISQSSLDASTDLTSSGAVNIITKSGSNKIHGSGFGLFRDESFAADQRQNKTVPTAEKPPFDRQILGGRVGGPFIKDKMFWHVEYERSNQDAQRFTNIPEFPQFSGAFGAPVDERTVGARLDWNATRAIRAFYRFNHNNNIGTTGFGGRDLAAFSNLNNTNSHVAGVDISRGNWTHQVRFSYLNFNNFVNPANNLAGTPETIAPGGEAVLVRIRGRLQDVGPDLLAPQSTFQDNKQTKYDGGVTFGRHSLRFGGSYNHIAEAVFASFFGLAPRIRASYTGGPTGTRAFANMNLFAAGGDTNPLNFPLDQIVFGNGLGAFSEKSALGFQFGGTINHRLGFYVQDSYKAHPNFTLNFGLRYNWNSMLSDSDLPRTPLIGVFDPTLAGKPNRPGDNFAPQAGFAWNVGGDGRTVIRGGAGIFHETNIINNVLFDRPINLPPGFGNDTPVINAGAPLLLDPGTGATIFDFSTGCAGSCFSQPLGTMIPIVAAQQAAYQAATAALSAGYPQPGVPPLFNQILSTAGSVVDVNYKTPYGIQMNIGVQREVKSGLVLAVDYVRNRGVNFNIVRDRNRLGAADTLDVAIAQAAIATTVADCGVADLAAVAALAAAGMPCPDPTFRGGPTSVTPDIPGMTDFSDRGLGAGSAVDGFAFRGMNPNFRDMGIIESIGLSLFQALQVRLNGNVGSWGPFKRIDTNLTYQLGRFESAGADQDFISGAGFNDRPNQFFGPANFDRTHQVGISFLVELPWGFHIATTNQFKTALPSSLFLLGTTFDADEIFYSDLDGDGVVEDPITGVTPRGAFSRDVKADELNAVIDNYNSTVAGTVLPAGQALISAGLFTEAQLISLGAVAVTVPNAPADQVNNDSFINSDIRISNKIRLGERVTVEPMLEIFNLFNIANYGRLDSFLDGGPGSPNGTSKSVNVAEFGLTRFGQGSGSFSPGTLRAFQFGVRVTF